MSTNKMQNNKTNGSKKDRHSNASKARRRGRQKDQRTELEMEDSRLSKDNRDNDPNWYFTSSELAAQAGELSIQEVLGNGPVLQEAGIPTCAVVYLNPCPGVSYSFTGHGVNYDDWTSDSAISVTDEIQPASAVVNDGANLMAFKMYTLMSSFTGRTQSYGPQDLLIMILAISQVAAISEHIRRMFGMALTVNARNRALPKGMMQAMGVNANDFIAHLADYRMRFNIQMTRINQVPLLDNIGFIRKCRDMYQKVYVDSDSPMGQNWIFAPYSTWILDEQSSSEGSFLRTVQLPRVGEIKTMDEWLGILTSMIDAILSSSTMQIVYSDLINLANKVNVPTWQFDYLAENYVVLPEYNRNAQLQFHNLDIAGTPFANWEPVGTSSIYTITPANDVRQDPSNNRIIYNPIFGVGQRETTSATGTVRLICRPHDTVVDFDTPTPTLEDRIEALRFSYMQSHYRIRIKLKDENQWQLGTFGGTLSDHYVVRINILEYPDNDDVIYCSDQAASDTQLVNHINSLGKFKDAPLMYILDASRTSITNHRCVRSIAGDVNFFTKVPFEYLQRTNRLMYTGLFDFRV